MTLLRRQIDCFIGEDPNLYLLSFILILRLLFNLLIFCLFPYSLQFLISIQLNIYKSKFPDTTWFGRYA